MGRDEIIKLLGLEPLEHEGGMFRRTFSDRHSSAIYFLIEAGKPTMLHRVPGTEVYHHYLGAPATVLLLGPDGEVAEHVLGPGLGAGQRPQLVVPGGSWQAVRTPGPWTLLGATMAPAFEWEQFELGRREDLLRDWPEAAESIRLHTSD